MKIAIVTGAGSGMGKEFAKKLDSQNLDEIWGVALHKEGLEELSKELKTSFVPFALDLSKKEAISVLRETLNEVKPEVLWLVNAAGYGKFDYYENISTETSLNMIDLNCKAMVELTDAAVPFMVEGSRIVDIASLAAFQPVPYGNIYSATKAFVLSYSRALGYELSHRKISVTCVCPYWTKTNFFKRAMMKNQIVKKYIVMYDANKVINKAFSDSLKRKKLSIYGFIAKAQVFLTKLLPASFACKVWIRQQKFEEGRK